MGVCCWLCGTMEEPDTDFPHQPCTLSDGKPCAPCQEHADLEIEIQEMAQRLADLKKKRHPMRNRINNNHPSIVKRFPLEIAAMIFQLSISNWEDDEDWTSSGLLWPRIKLGQICHDWRDIAWSTPRLWSIISINVFRQCRRSYINILQEWLARSGGMPLSVALHSSGSRDSDREDEYKKHYPCIDLINEHSHRWRNLMANLPGHLISRLRAHIPNPPMIETLRIRPTDSSGESKSRTAFRLENSRPSPKVVEISHIYFRSLDIDWSKVTNLDFEVVFYDECMEILRHTPQLTKCRFGRMIVGDGGFVTSASAITLPFLRHLDISHDNNLVMLTLFDRLMVPSLEEYHHDSNHGLFPVENFSSLLKRSSCSMKKLLLMDTRYSSNLVNFLRETPTLEKLDILTYEPSETETENFLNHLGATWKFSNDERTANDSLFLPNLRRLSIKGQRSFSWMTLANIFGSKYDHYGPKNTLSKVSIEESQEVVSTIGRPLQSLYIEIYPDIDSLADDHVDKDIIPRFVNAARGGVEFSGFWLSSSALHYGMTVESELFAYLPSYDD